MKKTIIFLFLLCLYSFNNAVNAADPFKIIWLKSDTPPFSILEPGPMFNQGTCDGLLKALIKAMPDIKHEEQVLPQSRIGKLMDEGAPVCYPCMFFREQATSRATYSIPAYIYPPFVVVTSSANAQKIRKKYGEPVDINALMQDELFQYGRMPARKFGAILDPIINSSGAYENSVVTFISNSPIAALYDLALKSRIDYFIEYPVSITHLHKQGYQGLSTINIKQLDNFLTKGAVGCSSTASHAFAETALSKINTALRETVLQSPSYQAFYNQWMSPSIPNYQQLFIEEILLEAQQKQRNQK